MSATACLLQVKAFGDLVIAGTAARRVVKGDRQRLMLAIGRHLRPLCDAINPVIEVIELDTSATGVPSIFDVRRDGLAAAARSAWGLRRSIARAPIKHDTILLFDRIQWRERFIAGARPAKAMPPHVPNIYQGYDQLLSDAGFGTVPQMPRSVRNGQGVGIFPGSRIPAKNLPVTLVVELMTQTERRGMETTLFLLEGERPDLEACGLPHVIVPRRFTALRDAIATMGVVISADSLPAHLAESLAIDVFVLTPRPNEFWMPHTVFAERRWCLFDDPDRLDRVGSLLLSRSV